jgi:diguanylate cyclase (GGDEF)-like protein
VNLARPRESVERGEIEPLLLEDLMRRSRVTFAFFLATLVLIRIVAAQAFHASAAVRIALGLTLLLALARWTFVWTYRRGGGEPRRGQAVFIGLTAAVGLGLALINVVAYPLLDAIHASMLGMIQIVINAIALSSMAGSLRIYFLYMLPNLGSFFVLTLLNPRPEFGFELPALVFLPIPALAAMAVWLHGSLRRNVVLERELRELALRDTLTQLYNRRFLMEFMAQESLKALSLWGASSTTRAIVATPSIGLVVVDVDHFKTINDRHGHAAGDAVLEQLARLLQATARQPDLTVRWGGEEFVVIARDSNREGAALLARRIHRCVGECAFHLPSGVDIRLAVSVGYALYPFREDEASLLGWEVVLTLADRALLEAKKRGRDRVCGVSPGEAPWTDTAAARSLLESDFERALTQDLVRIEEWGR